MTEVIKYLKLFYNYERRFKHITVLVPIELYNNYKFIFEETAKETDFIKYGEQSDIVIFRSWNDI